MPTLSLIVPIYNTAPYLKECLDSILSQKRKADLEVILIDDGSTDTSFAIAKEYEKNYPRLFTLFTKENGGLSSARNLGMQRATGEYIAFLDSDDALSPRYAEEVLKKAEETKADLILLSYLEWKDSSLSPVRMHRLSDERKNALLCHPMVWLRVFRASLLQGESFREGLYYEDLDFSCKMALKAKSFSAVKEPLYYYRQRKGSITKDTRSPHTEDIFPILEGVLLAARRAELFDACRAELEWLYIEHLLRSAALRFAERQEAKLLFARLRKAVETPFPRWQDNPYLKKSSFRLRLAVQLASRGHFRLIAQLCRGKELLS